MRLARYTSGFAMMRLTEIGRSVRVGPMIARPVKTV